MRQIELVDLGHYHGLGFCVADKYIKGVYYESNITEKFLDPIRLTALYFIVARNHRGASSDGIELRKFNKVTSSFDNVGFRFVKPEDGTETFHMYSEVQEEIIETYEMPEVKITIRPAGVLFIGSHFFVDTNLILNDGSYVSHGKLKHIFIDPRIKEVMKDRGPDWDLMVLHLLAAVLTLEGYYVTMPMMSSLGFHLAKVKRTVS